MLRKNLSPWLLEAVRIHHGKVYPFVPFADTEHTLTTLSRDGMLNNIGLCSSPIYQHLHSCANRNGTTVRENLGK